jgi:hypothetical protein
MHLDSCDGERLHAKLRIGSVSRALPDSIYGVLATSVPLAPCRTAVKILLKKGSCEKPIPRKGFRRCLIGEDRVLSPVQAAFMGGSA